MLETLNGQMALNKRRTCHVPVGLVSVTGQLSIKRYLAFASDTPSLPPLPRDWNWAFKVAGRGEYVGSLPKRIAKYYYQTCGVKLSSDVLGVIGSFANEYCNRNTSYVFDFVGRFDWEAGDFGDDGSCFWGGRSLAREKMQEYECVAMRFYDEDGDGYGRAWIADEGKYLVVFNGYGEETCTIAHVLAAYLGMSYRKVELSNQGQGAGLIYINGDKGYIIGMEQDINGVSAVDLNISEGVLCADCNEFISEDDDYHAVDHGYLCESCFNQNYLYCEDCEEIHQADDMSRVHGCRRDRWVCEDCLDSYTECSECQKYYDSSEINEVDEIPVCYHCVKTGPYSRCKYCGDLHHNDNMIILDDNEIVCNDCIEGCVCSECGKYSGDPEVIHGELYCDDCREAAFKRENPLLVEVA